jgi:hypothetical protein
VRQNGFVGILTRAAVIVMVRQDIDLSGCCHAQKAEDACDQKAAKSVHR